MKKTNIINIGLTDDRGNPIKAALTTRYKINVNGMECTAIKWTGDNWADVDHHIGNVIRQGMTQRNSYGGEEGYKDHRGPVSTVVQFNDQVTAISIGDYIVKTKEGDIFPINQTTLEQYYTPL